MLYRRWRTIAKEHSDRVAIRELASGCQWTFHDLADAAESRPPSGSVSAPIYPEGSSVHFILAVLEAWKSERVVCPLESGQVAARLPPPPRGIAHLKTTSATTGSARGVIFTAAQIAADADQIVATMGLRPDSPSLGVISLAHSYGFSNLVTPLLLHGIPLILGSSILPEGIRQALAAIPNLTVPAVPALWRAWHEANALQPGVRLAISAGAPLPVELESAIFRASAIKVHNFYGSTESGGIAYDQTAEPRTEASGVGSPLQGVAVTTTPEGCLEISSAAVGASYWPDRDDRLAEGRYRSSDLGMVRNGCVYLHGRSSDLIHVAGRKVAPEEIEQTLRSHPEVRDCLVFGVPATDQERGEWVAACVVARSQISEHSLREFLLQRLPAWQVPREWRWLESLDVNARGKLSRSEWKARLFSERNV